MLFSQAVDNVYKLFAFPYPNLYLYIGQVTYFLLLTFCGKFKGALISFRVMCKIITHSIQSRLLYVPAKFQGLKTNRTRATINFLRLFKTGNYFCGIVVCDVKVRLRPFEKTFCHGRNADIQDYARKSPIPNESLPILKKQHSQNVSRRRIVLYIGVPPMAKSLFKTS